MRRLKTIAAFLLALSPSTGAIAQSSFIKKKPAPVTQAPPPAPKPVPVPAAVPKPAPKPATQIAPAPRKEQLPSRRTTAAAPKREAPKPLTPPALPLGPADLALLDSIGRCEGDMREFLSRFPASGRGRAQDVYLMPPGAKVNGWPVKALTYTEKSTATNSARSLYIFVEAPEVSLMDYGKRLPNMAFNATPSSIDPALPEIRNLARIFGMPVSGQLLLAQDQTAAAIMQQGNRRMAMVLSLPPSHGMISCAQYSFGTPTASALSAPVRGAPAPDLPKAFLDGSLRFIKSSKSGCADIYTIPAMSNQLDTMIRTGDWNNLARRLIAAQCRTDFAYLMLGRAAEGMGLGPAATSFYKEAYKVTMEFTLKFSGQCLTAEGAQCRGLNIGQEANAGIDRASNPGPRLGPYALRPANLTVPDQEVSAWLR